MQRLYPTSKAQTTPEDIYDDIRFPEPPEGRPYVALNMVSTVDGKATLDEGRIPGPIGSPVDRSLMERLRVPVDAVIRGAATVRRSPYYPGVPEELEHRRIHRGLPRQPLLVIVTKSGRLPLEEPVFQRAPRRPLVVLPEDEPVPSGLRDWADVWQIGRGGVDFVETLARLRTEGGAKRVLSEGGPRLNWEFLRRGLLDELFWTVAPKIGGASFDLTLVHGPEPLRPQPALELLSAYAGDSELFLRYRIKKEPSPQESGPGRSN